MRNDKAYYSRLKKKFSYTLILVALLPLFLISWRTSIFYQNTCLQNTTNVLSDSVENKKKVITFFLTHQTGHLEELIRLYHFNQLKDQATLERIFSAISQEGGYVDLGVIDGTGKHIAYVGPYRSQLLDKSYEKAPWFQEVMTNGAYLSDIFLGFRNVPHFIVAVADPLRNWVLRATINSEFLYGLIRDLETGERGDAFIVNRFGEFQTPSRFSEHFLPVEASYLLSRHEGTKVRKVGEFVYVSSWLKNGEWVMVVQLEAKSVYKTFQEARNLDLIALLIASLTIITSSVLIIRYMVDKIEEADREKAVFDSQMLQVDKMASLGIMAAGLAHEVNNPLQLITDQADWIRELLDEEDPATVRNIDEYRKSAEKIKMHVMRASGVTHRLLGFSRKMESQKGAVNVNKLLEEVSAFVVNEAANNNININQHFQDDIPAIMTDSAQLQQVFLNILNNGIDAIGKNGAIDITTWAEDRNIIIKFEDSGPGIEKEVMEHIFDPFFTTKEPGKGTGLGMAISYHIIQSLGGKIEVGNRKKGGAVFTLVLPIVTMSKSRKE